MFKEDDGDVMEKEVEFIQVYNQKKDNFIHVIVITQLLPHFASLSQVI